MGIESNGSLLGFTSYESWQSQSEHMIPEIDKLLKEFNLTRKDISGIVTSIGPGSYTGVRISLTIAKVIALCLNAPVYPVSSLRVLKDGEKPSICLINARSNRSYFGVYEGHKVIINDCIKTNDDVLAYIKEHPEFESDLKEKYLKDGEVDYEKFFEDIFDSGDLDSVEKKKAAIYFLNKQSGIEDYLTTALASGQDNSDALRAILKLLGNEIPKK